MFIPTREKIISPFHVLMLNNRIISAQSVEAETLRRTVVVLAFIISLLIKKLIF